MRDRLPQEGKCLSLVFGCPLILPDFPLYHTAVEALSSKNEMRATVSPVSGHLNKALLPQVDRILSAGVLQQKV